MTWMMTASGQTIDLRLIDPEKIHIEDVAYSLSNIHRFNGHAHRQVSVAEHSLVVCDVLSREFKIKSPAVLMAGLLHDAHEYLTGDLSQPMKQLIGEPWRVEEDRIQKITLLHFGVWTAFCTSKKLIHDADMYALTGERVQLMTTPEDHALWPCQITHPALAWLKYPADGQFTAADWQRAFIDKFDELNVAAVLANAAIPQIK
jgi:hypothetical protein